MLTAAQVIQRRVFYRCCAHDYLSAAREAYIHGDTKCGDENTEKMLYMHWAAGVMCRTPVQDGESGCLTIEFASKVASAADCCCDCDCLPARPPFENDCTVDVQYTVIDAVAQSALPAEPDEGDQYYIIEGDEIGNIATWSEGEWVYSSIPLYSVVLSEEDGDYYTNNGLGPGLLFPPLDGEFIEANNQYEIVSSQPQIAINSTRTIVLYAYVNGSWATLFSGLESVFATPQLFDFGTLQVTAVRAQYVVGNCSYYVPVILEPPIDECVFPGDHDCQDHQVTSHF